MPLSSAVHARPPANFDTMLRRVQDCAQKAGIFVPHIGLPNPTELLGEVFKKTVLPSAHRSISAAITTPLVLSTTASGSVSNVKSAISLSHSIPQSAPNSGEAVVRAKNNDNSAMSRHTSRISHVLSAPSEVSECAGSPPVVFPPSSSIPSCTVASSFAMPLRPSGRESAIQSTLDRRGSGSEAFERKLDRILGPRGRGQVASSTHKSRTNSIANHVENLAEVTHSRERSVASVPQPRESRVSTQPRVSTSSASVPPSHSSRPPRARLSSREKAECSIRLSQRRNLRRAAHEPPLSNRGPGVAISLSAPVTKTIVKKRVRSTSTASIPRLPRARSLSSRSCGHTEAVASAGSDDRVARFRLQRRPAVPKRQPPPSKRTRLVEQVPFQMDDDDSDAVHNTENDPPVAANVGPPHEPAVVLEIVPPSHLASLVEAPKELAALSELPMPPAPLDAVPGRRQSTLSSSAFSPRRSDVAERCEEPKRHSRVSVARDPLANGKEVPRFPSAAVDHAHDFGVHQTVGEALAAQAAAACIFGASVSAQRHYGKQSLDVQRSTVPSTAVNPPVAGTPVQTEFHTPLHHLQRCRSSAAVPATPHAPKHDCTLHGENGGAMNVAAADAQQESFNSPAARLASTRIPSRATSRVRGVRTSNDMAPGPGSCILPCAGCESGEGDESIGSVVPMDGVASSAPSPSSRDAYKMRRRGRSGAESDACNGHSMDPPRLPRASASEDVVRKPGANSMSPLQRERLARHSGSRRSLGSPSTGVGAGVAVPPADRNEPSLRQRERDSLTGEREPAVGAQVVRIEACGSRSVAAVCTPASGPANRAGAAVRGCHSEARSTHSSTSATSSSSGSAVTSSDAATSSDTSRSGSSASSSKATSTTASSSDALSLSESEFSRDSSCTSDDPSVDSSAGRPSAPAVCTAPPAATGSCTPPHATRWTASKTTHGEIRGALRRIVDDEDAVSAKPRQKSQQKGTAGARSPRAAATSIDECAPQRLSLEAGPSDGCRAASEAGSPMFRMRVERQMKKKPRRKAMEASGGSPQYSCTSMCSSLPSLDVPRAQLMSAEQTSEAFVRSTAALPLDDDDSLPTIPPPRAGWNGGGKRATKATRVQQILSRSARLRAGGRPVYVAPSSP